MATVRVDVGEGVARGAVDLRDAAQAVGVLHLAAVAVRLADGAAREQRAQVAGRGRLAGMRPRGVDARVEGHVGALERVEGQGARPRRRVRARRMASARARPPTAVMSCVPLMRARPSLASSTTGARPAAAQRLGAGQAPALVDALAFADEREREVREGRQVAARADRALRRG